jgi:hypothetical protein
MTTPTFSGSDATSIVIVAVIVLILVRRVIGMVRGAPVRPARMFAITALFVALLAFTLLLSFSQLPIWTYGVDVVVLLVAAAIASQWVRRQVVMEWKNGEWTYRLGVLIPVVYLVLFVVRLTLDLVVLGVNPFAGTPPGTTPLSGQALLVVAVVDALFAFSTGLLVGRTVGVYLEYEARLQAGPPGSPPAPAAALR